MARYHCELRGYTIIDMTRFGAQNRSGLEVSLREVEPADIFVGIYAHRYGYIPQDYDKSITEAEFWQADTLGKPRLLFKYHFTNPLDCPDEAIKTHQD